MRVEVVRLDDDRLQLTIRFPSGGETLDVRIARAQLLQQLDVEADEVLNGGVAPNATSPAVMF